MLDLYSRLAILVLQSACNKNVVAGGGKIANANLEQTFDNLTNIIRKPCA